ncbi:MAG: CHAT domain-containing protein [Saprospiraceae bacterium]
MDKTYEADTIKANSIKKEADLLFEQSAFEAAIQQLDKAITLFAKHDDWENIVDCTVQQAYFSDNIDYDSKKIYAEKSLRLAKQYLGKNHLQLGYAYNQIGELKALEENYDSAIIFFDKGLEIFKSHQSWEAYTWALISQGVSHYYNQQNDKFKNNLLAAQAKYKKYELDEEIYIATLDLFGVIYYEAENYDKGIENTLKSIDFYLSKSNLNPLDSFYIADNYYNLGVSYNRIQAHQKSTIYFNKANGYFKKNDREKYVRILIEKSQIAENSYNPRESIRLLTLAKKELIHLPTKELQAYITRVNESMGYAYLLLNELDSSAYYLKSALNTASEKSKSISNLTYCSILLQTERPLEAITLLDQVNINHKSIHYSRLNRKYGIAYGLLGNFEKSMLYFQKALHYNCPTFTDTLNYYANPTTISGIKNPDFFLFDLQYKAKTLQQFPEKLKNLESALETYELSLQFIDTLRTRYAYNENRIINKRNQEVYERTIDLAHLLYEKTKDEKYAHKAFVLSEKFKSNILLSSSQNTGNQQLIPEVIQEQEQTLAANTAFYERQLQQAKKDKNEVKIKMYENNLTDYRLDLINLKDSIKVKYPKYYDLKYAYDISTIPTIQQDLASNQGFISYYLGDSSTYVFTISKDDFHFSKLDSTTTIDKKVTAFRQMLGQPNLTVEGFAEYNETATDLYDAVLQQSVEQLSKSVNQLTIIPDRTLNNIPFEILTNKVVQANQDFSKLPYLLYDYQIHYAYSATLLRENERIQSQLKTNDKCLAYAPPYESNQPIAKRRGTMQALRDGTMQLQGTGKEIQAIATHFDGDFDQSETATKTNFVEQAPNFGILHLAMHGEANFENENLANLKFTNTKTQDKEQYLLYQNEIANMNLNAQLVVLSACETGLGKYIYGEGIASLGRSFMYAGVPSIVMSLWKVDDQATSRLMPYFYKNLAQGMNKDEALYQAKLTFLKREDLSTLHPHYWAGFVSIGDVQPIKKGRNWGFLLIFGSVLLMLVSGFLIWWKLKNKKRG